MKIAIPVWEDKVSPVLDTASRLLIVELEDQKEASRFETYLDEQDLSRRCVRIRRLGVDTLICGAISRGFSKILEASGIRIVPGISGHPEDVLDAYVNGNLFRSKFFMPGYQRNDHTQRKKGKTRDRGN
jgi:predicted Fe-Mo cluster-binding NifX family protein